MPDPQPDLDLDIDTILAQFAAQRDAAEGACPHADTLDWRILVNTTPVLTRAALVVGAALLLRAWL